MVSAFDLKTRSGLKRLMRSVGLHPSMLTGDHRRATSSRALPTMRGRLSDPIEYFRKALNIELEHGSVNEGTDVTGNDEVATARIVAAHLLGVEHDADPSEWKPFPSYYDHLIYMEKHGQRPRTDTGR